MLKKTGKEEKMNIKFPENQKEFTQENWDSIKVGDKVLQIEWSHWHYSYCYSFYEVIKITPKGSLRLDNDKLIKKSESGNYYIFTPELASFIKKIQLEDKLINLLYEIDRHKKEFKKNLEYKDAKMLCEKLESIVKNMKK